MPAGIAGILQSYIFQTNNVVNIESLILDLAFILLLGACVTVLFKWIKQPVVLGYIVAGFLASPHFRYLPTVASEGNIDFWAEIGIVVLLFSLGLEFSFKKLVNTGGSAVVTALIIVSGMMGAGYIVGHAMGFSSINCLFLGGMLSMSSTTIIIKAFTDLGLKQKKFASMVLAVLIVEDLFAVVMMVVLSSIAVNNSVEGSELALSIAKLVFFLVIWFLVGVYVLPSVLNACNRFLNGETLLIVSMGLCLGMAVFSVYCGFSLALGAFVMGSILAGTSYAERIEHVVTPVKDLFGAVFFISVGMMVNPDVIAQYWGPILILSVVVIIGMITFGTFGMLVTGQTLRVAIQSGFSLTQIGEFAFIIATLGMSLGVLEPTIYPIVVAVSVLTTFTTPMFIKASLPAYDFVEKHLPGRLRFLIDRYQKTAATEQAVGQSWFRRIGSSIFRTLIYVIVLVAISLMANVWFFPWINGLIPEWSNMLTMTVTLIAMMPFLMMLMMPLSRTLTGFKNRTGTTIQSIPKIVLGIFNFIIALYFIIHVVSTNSSMKIGLCVALVVVLLLLTLFSRRVKQQMSTIENRFMDNLNERELRRSGKNNSLVSDLHLAYVTVGNAGEFVGRRLKDWNIRDKYGINIVSVQRGLDTYTIPSADMRIFPGDVLGLIGNDDNLSAVGPLIEAECETQPASKSQGQFKLFSLLLSENSPLIGKTPRTSHLRARYDALIVAVERGDEFIDQNPDLAFAKGDILWIVGDRQHLFKDLGLA